MIPIKFSRPLDFSPINAIEPNADMVGSRYYNKSVIYDPTDPSIILFEKAWYECTDNGESASPRYTWVKVNEGGGDVTIDPNGGLVKGTNGLKINNDAVTEERLADDSVTTNKIADSQVTADKLASDSVTTVKVIDDAITTSKIVDNAITTAKINPSTTNGQVLTTKNGATSWETPTAVDGTTISDSGNIHLTGEVPTLVSGTNIQFGQDANGKWGYKVGADAVVPFKNPTGTLDVFAGGVVDVDEYQFVDIKPYKVAKVSIGTYAASTPVEFSANSIVICTGRMRYAVTNTSSSEGTMYYGNGNYTIGAGVTGYLNRPSADAILFDFDGTISATSETQYAVFSY